MPSAQSPGGLAKVPGGLLEILGRQQVSELGPAKYLISNDLELWARAQILEPRSQVRGVRSIFGGPTTERAGLS